MLIDISVSEKDFYCQFLSSVMQRGILLFPDLMSKWQIGSSLYQSHSVKPRSHGPAYPNLHRLTLGSLKNLEGLK